MIKFKEVDDFINAGLASKQLHKESMVLIIDESKATFSFTRDLSFLNVEGSYDFIFVDGEKINDGTRKHGDVVSIWGLDTNGKILGENQGAERRGGYDDALSNSVFDGKDSLWMNVEKWRSDSVRKSPKADGEMVSVGHQRKFNEVASVMILDKPTLFYKDSYGHDHTPYYKYNCVALVVGRQFKQTFNPSNESTIVKFKDYNKI